VKEVVGKVEGDSYNTNDSVCGLPSARRVSRLDAFNSSFHRTSITSS
jgi:hypothetical protein